MNVKILTEDWEQLSNLFKSKIIVIAELRMVLAEFSKEGTSKVSIYDLLTVLDGLAYETEANSTV